MSQAQARIPRLEVSIPEEDEDSDSGGSDQMESVSMGIKRRPSRISFSKLWKFSVLSVDPSPRVSTIDGPVSTLGNIDTYYKTVRIRRSKLKLCCCSFTLMCITTFIMTTIAILFATKTLDIPYCTGSDDDNILPRDLISPDIFDDLTTNEYHSVIQYLLDYHHLGLVPYENASITDSYIYLIELHLPKKEDALQYLDEQSKQPDRIAKAVIYRGNATPPVVEEYLVFPLPSPNEAVFYKNPSYRRHPIPFNSRPMDSIERQCLYEVIVDSCMADLHPLLQKSYNASYHNCTHGKTCIEVQVSAPYSNTNGVRMTWLAAYQSVDDSSLHPLGLQLLVKHEGTNTSEWSTEEIIYNRQSFPNTSALMDAFLSETLVLSYMPIHKQKSHAHDTRNLQDTKQGPFLYEPIGKRFTVIGQRIVYNMWSFYYHMCSSTGLMLFDIKFNAVRIAYEISLQDAIVSYFEHESSVYNTSNFDLSWLFGSPTTELIRGIDCPDNAVYITSDVWSASGSVETIRNNVCVFENSGAIPLQRHYANDEGGHFKSYSGINNYHLIIRTIILIGSNDYILDYIFHTNGVLNVKVSVSGNIRGSLRLWREEQYGGVVSDSIVANIHIHLLNFKVDLDIAGTANRFTTLSVAVNENKQIRVSKSENKHGSNTLHLKSELKEYEGVLDKYSFQNPQNYIIHNIKAKDIYQSSRAYRIYNKSPLHSLQENVWTKLKKECLQYPIFVTKRKDTEQSSTSIYSIREPNDPVMSMSDYFNGERIVDVDLVAWVTMGLTHIPGTEDVPLSPTNLNHMSFMLAPHNYFTHNPSSSSRDHMVIHRQSRDTAKTVIQSQPVSSGLKCVPKALKPYDNSFDRN